MSSPLGSDPGQAQTRATLRTVGPLVLGAGVLLTVIAFVDFFASFGGFEPPRFFWCAFLGMPLIAVGAALCKFGYVGAVTRYVAGEVAPVARDTVNYLAEGTHDGVKELARAVGEGLAPAVGRVCPQCKTEKPADARFCKGCGTALPEKKVCPECGHPNEPDARFCDHCGGPLV